MYKSITIIIVFVLGLAVVVLVILYGGERQKNLSLRTENLKTAEEIQVETKKLKNELKEERARNGQDKQKLLEQVAEFSRQRDKAVEEAALLKKTALKEREFSLTAGSDLEIIRGEVAKIKKEGNEGILRLQEAFKKKQQVYDTRILSLDAQLQKARKRLAGEAERYHYNLGVIYTQNKDFESAVREYKAALGANAKNAQTHYNLGIIYDDYFKDKGNARYHYRSFLELSPQGEDAESVRAWLKDLEK